MSHEIIKSISIVKDKVYITSASSNVSPRTFERWESDYRSGLLQNGGMEMLLKSLSADIWTGNFHLQKGGSQLCKNLLAGYEVLCYDHKLRNFLDTDHAAQYMADFVLNIMGKKQFPDIGKLYALREDKESVLEVCKKRPDAFNYAAEHVQKDREAAKQYIQTCGDQTLFSMPVCFCADKDLAMMALEKNGTIYRRLDSHLQADKDIICLAFDPSKPRRYFEHLPDLIPESVRKDKAFMIELVKLCPRMHVHRIPEYMEDKDFVKAWLEAGAWTPFALQNVSKNLLKDPELQAIIFNMYKNAPEQTKKIEQIFAELEIEKTRPTLDTILQAAQNKTQVQQAAPGHVKEAEMER